MRFTKILATGLALTIAATSFVSTADAGRRNRRHHGDAFAPGLFLASQLERYWAERSVDRAIDTATIHTIIIIAIMRPGYYYQEPRYYYAPPPRIYYHRVPEYYGPSDYYGPCSIPGGSRSRPAYAWC
jgi:hypothetical protein